MIITELTYSVEGLEHLNNQIEIVKDALIYEVSSLVEYPNEGSIYRFDVLNSLIWNEAKEIEGFLPCDKETFNIIFEAEFNKLEKYFDYLINEGKRFIKVVKNEKEHYVICDLIPYFKRY